VNNQRAIASEDLRKSGTATAVLQAIAILLLLGFAYVSLNISHRFSEVQDGVRENALWSVYQTDREARKLHEELHIMISLGHFDSKTVKQTATRYDILYSRMSILETATFEARFRTDTNVTDLIAKIRKSVLGNEPTFDAAEAGKAIATSEWMAVDRDMEMVIDNSAKLLIYTNSIVSIERVDARQNVEALQIKSTVLIAMLVCCAVMLVVILRRQLSSLRTAGRMLEAASNKMNQAYLDAQAGNRARSQFMATIGHEIRTPLNAILGTAELLELSGLPSAVMQGVQTIRRSGVALLEIINEILDFAKIEHGRLEVETRSVDICALAQNTLEMIQARASEQGNMTAIDMPDAFAMPIIKSDPTRLRQVMLNLLSNAVKFTKNGKVTLRLTQLPETTPMWLLVEVIDTGIGIDGDGLARLFQPFSQVDASISRKYGGTGLGLTICKQIIEALGGEIGVRSQKGEGSTFWFRVPIAAAETPANLDKPHAAPSIGETPTLKILLVEDNLVNRQVAVGFLTHLGQDVSFAIDGVEAVEAAKAHEFDIILMDMQMPRMDGIEATRLIRSLGGSNASVPIIAMTANASDDDRQLCEKAGMTGFQSKPISLSQLKTLLQSQDCGVKANATISGGISQARPHAVSRYAEIEPAFAARKAEIVAVLSDQEFDQLLSEFFADAQAIIDTLLQSLEVKDVKATERALHTLKGAASNIGFQTLADVAEDLRHEQFTTEDIARLREHLTRNQRIAA